MKSSLIYNYQQSTNRLSSITHNRKYEFSYRVIFSLQAFIGEHVRGAFSILIF